MNNNPNPNNNPDPNPNPDSNPDLDSNPDSNPDPNPNPNKKKYEEYDKEQDKYNEQENEQKERMPIKKIKLIITEAEQGFTNDDILCTTTLKARYYCENSKCDHKKYLAKWYDENKVGIIKVETIKDLIEFGNYYHCRMRRMYNGIDLKILFSIREYLQELDMMIGLSEIKEEIVNMIIYLMIIKGTENVIKSDMLHLVVTGSPGCGKTTFIEIIAKIYTKLGVLKKGHIVKAKRSDLIGKYLGHTASQTQNKINEAKGGILLIDEAYSLGNPEGRDSFSKECIDTLNQALSENKSEFICIIAGYKNALDNSFFNYNEGLRRRFPFRFDITAYKATELAQILMKKIYEYKIWDIEFNQEQLDKEIKNNFKYFENQGGDMESLFLNLKIVHNKRVFLLPIDDKKKLLLKDIKESVDKFIFLKGDYLKNKNDTLFGLYV